MESSESHEPSYYEVALTNRQVLIAFVVLLTSIVAAFLSGVWIGRGGSSVAAHPPGAAGLATVAIESPLEQLTFFNGKDAGARTGLPAAAGSPAVGGAATGSRAPTATDNAPAETSAEAKATEAMRQNLDATMAANRTVAAPAASPPQAASPPSAGTRAATPAPPPSTAPARPAAPATKAAAPTKGTPAAKPAATGTAFVQVYSSSNAARAKKVVAQLKKAGFAVAVAETPKNGATNYRVRVGPYADRNKADSAASRLRREFRLETWVTDSP